MTPQEKAIELVDKMGFSTSYTIDNTSWQSTPIYKNQYAKKCAIIAVDEIMKLFYRLDDEYKYWQNVKTEIEKL
jgi:hypothetical protein